MGYKTKVQLIQRKDSQQWMFNIPAAIGAALELKKGETLDLTIENKNHLVVRRLK
jgi:antitoxin component of MazEF toxin-antitoxin module